MWSRKPGWFWRAGGGWRALTGEHLHPRTALQDGGRPDEHRPVRLPRAVGAGPAAEDLGARNCSLEAVYLRVRSAVDWRESQSAAGCKAARFAARFQCSVDSMALQARRRAHSCGPSVRAARGCRARRPAPGRRRSCAARCSPAPPAAPGPPSWCLRPARGGRRRQHDYTRARRHASACGGRSCQTHTHTRARCDVCLRQSRRAARKHLRSGSSRA